MLGGVVWACGNVWVVPIVKTIGLAMGLLIWGMVNMLMGWASGRFGLFGLTPDSINSPTLNTLGVLFAVAALGVFFFVKPDLSGDKPAAKSVNEDDDHESAYAGLLYKENELGLTKPSSIGGLNDGQSVTAEETEEPSWTDKLTPKQKQLFGVSASIASGLLYGCNFDPPSYVADHIDQFPGASTDLSTYIFPHFCGIFITSVFFVQAYALYSRNSPKVYPEVIFPGFISGLMWAIAQICWFQANTRLELVVAFPIISVGPGLIGAAWGVFVFGEIKGKRNYMLLITAFILTATSAALTVLSKM